MSSALWVVILLVSLILSFSILMQNKGAALSLTFGGSGSYYSSQRGMQKFLHWTAIVSAVSLFILVLLFNFFVPAQPSTSSSAGDIPITAAGVQATDAEGNPVNVEIKSDPITITAPE